jgi:urease subunit alpha
VSRAALDAGIHQQLGLLRRTVAVGQCRGLTKRDMVNNSLLPKIEVDPDTYEVRVEGELITCEPAQRLAMAQRYFLF